MSKYANLKKYLVEIDVKSAPLCALSDEIWDYAETAFEEFQSAETLAAYLEQEGFKVVRNACGIKTAFSASFGSGKPKIGILGEFDALAGLSQISGIAEPQPIVQGANGHGCGHNLLGVGSLAAALAVKKYLEDGHSGTVIYYGCPGEEGGSGKAFMARDGAFSDLDCALTWHPSTMNNVSQNSSLANFQVKYTFHGISAHAAGCPEMGRSALDALELMNVGTNFLREHMLDKARVHYAITNTGGFSPNVVQNYASATYLIRAPKMNQAYALSKRVEKIADGAATMTETTVEHHLMKSCANMVSNQVLEQLLDECMHDIGFESCTEEEYELAKSFTQTQPAGADRAYTDMIEDHLDKENKKALHLQKLQPYYDFVIPYESLHVVRIEGGSTDVGDVSYMCPTAQLHAATWAPNTTGHSWQVVAQGKSSYAHKGMLFAGRVIALTAMCLLQSPELIEQAKEEHKMAIDGETYIPIPANVMPKPISSTK